MQPLPLPLVKDLVLIGGGHAHALVLRMWGMDPLPGVRITVINPGPVAPYTGMLPGLIAGHYRRDEIMIDLVRLARFAGARVILGQVTGIDRAARRVLVDGASGPQAVAYDVASVDIGIASDLPEVPGFDAHGVAAKPLGAYAARWAAFVDRCRAVGAEGQPPRVTVIGGGVGGVELALASAHRLRAAGLSPQICVLEQAAAALPNLGAAARGRLLARMAADGIVLRTGTAVAALTADGVVLAGGEVLPSDFTLAVAGGRPAPWLADTGLGLAQGFIAVGPTLQSDDPAIFAAGDVAHLTHAPRPKAGVFAVRAAPVLHHNLRAALTGQALRPYHPQRDYLKLVSLGGRSALADKFGLRAGGGWLWRLKDRIDRAFMDKFADYPAMRGPAVPVPAVLGLAEAMGDRPLCGGCGAKVGPAVLGAVTATLPPPARGDVLSGPGDDAAMLRAGDGAVQVLTTDHLRAVTQDPALMARIAATHALGDIWAMGAAPQAALAQITLPRLGADLQGRMLDEVMQGLSAVVTAAGADLVGGHTAIGSELVVGLTLTGLVQRPLTKGGARAGDALILTKPLGSGTILAAEMTLARMPRGAGADEGPMLGEVWQAAIDTMLRPLAPAAAILSPHAHAMTDVTGFGLAGHLAEMLRASGGGTGGGTGGGIGAVLSLSSLPILPGADALAAGGVASSLAPQNRAATDWLMSVPPALDRAPRRALLHDPQTCGGLLAAVPGDQAARLLSDLTAAGEVAAIIGHVVAIDDGAPLVSLTA